MGSINNSIGRRAIIYRMDKRSGRLRPFPLQSITNRVRLQFINMALSVSDCYERALVHKSRQGSSSQICCSPGGLRDGPLRPGSRNVSWQEVYRGQGQSGDLYFGVIEFYDPNAAPPVKGQQTFQHQQTDTDDNLDDELAVEPIPPVNLPAAELGNLAEIETSLRSMSSTAFHLYGHTRKSPRRYQENQYRDAILSHSQQTAATSHGEDLHLRSAAAQASSVPLWLHRISISDPLQSWRA
ncbi:hypothetical protein ACHAPE_004024 [Trichoderma viride]